MMKPTAYKVLALFSIFTLSTPVIANECKVQAQKIIQQQKEKHLVSYEYELQKITLTDIESNVSKTRELKRYGDYTKKNHDKTLLAFIAPNDIKGAALLTWEQEQRDNDQWQYLPALKKMKRIASSGKQNYFMGTDFTYNDLASEKISDYNYKCLAMKKCSKKSKNICYFIEATPKSRKIKTQTGYSKRILKIKKKNLLTSKVTYFNKRGKHFKTLINVKWKKYTKNAWRPDKMIMSRMKKHKTQILVSDRSVDKKIPEVTFTERYVLKGMHIK